MHEELEDTIGTRENNWKSKYVFILELSSAKPLSSLDKQYMYDLSLQYPSW